MSSPTMGESSFSSSEVDRYHLIERIGHGSFGTVWKGFDSIAGREVAVKVVELEEMYDLVNISSWERTKPAYRDADSEDDIAEIQEEIAALKTCRSPHIVQYYGCHVVPGTSQLRIVMELMAASAADLAAPEDAGANGTPPIPLAISEVSIAYIIRQVLKALVYLHSAGRLHRDVKAANVLLSSRGEVKVSDFGVSAQLSGTVGYKRRTFVGSPLWMAPEVIEQSPEARSMPGSVVHDPETDADSGYDTAADIWSLGIAAIELARGEPPRAHVTSFRLLFMIVRDEPPSLDGPDFSTEFRDFVWQCLRKNPAERPTALDLLLHPFVVGADVPPPELPAAIAACLQRQRLAAARARRATIASPALPTGDGMATLPALPAPPSQAVSQVTSLQHTLSAQGLPAATSATSNDGMRSPTGGTPRWNFSLPRQPSVTATDGVAVAAAAAAAAAAATTTAGGPSGTWRRTQASVTTAPTAPAASPSPPPVFAPSPPPSYAGTAALPAYAVTQSPPPGPTDLPSPTRDAPDSSLYGTVVARGHDPSESLAAPEATLRRRGNADARAGGGDLARGTLRADTEAVASSAALGRVLRPALLNAVTTPEGAAAADGVFAALVELEHAQPGATQALLGETLLGLSANTDPELQALRSSALLSFGGGAPVPTSDALPMLGPLGGFLLARWREQVVRERIQHQHQQWEN